MTQQEFTNVAAYLKAAYPANNFLPTREVIAVWYEDLKDLDGQVCMKAMREYVKNNDFPPTIAGIRRSCSKEIKAFAKPYNEAWDEVLTAVSKYGTYGTVEAMKSFDEITRKCVKQIGFYEICTNPNTGILKRDFKEAYEEYKKEYDNKAQANSTLPYIEGKEQVS